jgi:hypothetical protein
MNNLVCIETQAKLPAQKKWPENDVNTSVLAGLLNLLQRSQILF